MRDLIKPEKAEVASVRVVIPGSHILCYFNMALTGTINNVFFPSETIVEVETLIVSHFPTVLIVESVQIAALAGISGCSGQTQMISHQMQSAKQETW